ncbi:MULTISPECIES: alcohol dehydrogenase catalytic domain-containing protein [Pseudonocardia]|uniref:NDMA-dependent alcohol dehydrogenase n=2 Tax=Pseudonocardia TaxID=1847 RepID=A0A1Y2MQQ9_PSEAH|nr:MULTISPECIES: alcohol dehydrogenase catalytic domain-containing protein [Pseudonocardia]OSY37047.1 NDMA-dependent alcohol dehydrogenase [Pseudonocardia autotrophica]TDN72020.1 S-(hydroxymethyl)glutathione dehydrogenase/alcohol dehydrogenase [Pseudonocardia autotrophica]BBG02715.1 putative zinc-type alcohol dehydrogenase AdhD [Pseudonocardia autotrophica]GEC25952.1 putative zinc-type alcohol dehydrogenase AdhD [Pseudonocardia saturnea]
MGERAAVVWPGADAWSVEPVELAPPRAGEVLVRIEAAGLCHSDAHLLTGGYAGLRRPMVGGHEGAGVVEAVGPGVTLVGEGDHVVFAFMPSCGTCPDCTAGRQHLCVLGAGVAQGFAVSDGTPRRRARDTDLGSFCFVGSFATRTVVHERSVVRCDPALPLDEVCLLGCAGITGWGAAVNTAGVGVGDTTVVVGVGGIGAMALLGARYAGAGQVWAVDPVGSKRDAATDLGADGAAASTAGLAAVLRDETRGRMADQVILCAGTGDGAAMAEAMALLGKQGRAVVVNVHDDAEREVRMSLRDLQSYEKQVRGCLAGSWSPRHGLSTLLDLYGRGRIPLEKLVTARYPLEKIHDGVADQEAGRNVRGVLLPAA